MNHKSRFFIISAVIIYLCLKSVQCIEGRIIGGKNATENEIKYIVAIRIGKYQCGGGIIGNKFIITAAHCVHLYKNGYILQPSRIVAATTNIKKYDNRTIVIDIVRAFLPGVYGEKGISDIAILELAKSLELKKNKNRLQKLNLPKPTKFNTYPSYDNARFKFAGYGKSYVDMQIDENGKMHCRLLSDGGLHVANASVVDKNTCQKSWKKFKILDNHICISIIEDEEKKKDQGTCKGDSGSPAVIDNEVIIGIDSVGSRQCNNNFRPTIFTRISSYIPFIKNVLKGKTNETVIYSIKEIL